jgi:hypothetical protein
MPLKRPFRIAVITTVYRPLSHSDVIVSRWIEPRERDAEWGWSRPRTQIASMYVDQFPDNDMARAISAKHGIPLFSNIRDALTCPRPGRRALGGKRLAVDAVLLIGEHGEYPTNSIGQKLYPRKEFFDQIVETLRREGRSIPVFCDKHLSWNFDWAREMIATVRELGIPFLAGSSLSHCPLDPPIRLAREPDIAEVVSVFFDSTEHYGFHSLEVIQSLIEKRRGGEIGIRAVSAFQGENIWRALDSGAWSADLMHAALGTARSFQPGDCRDNCRKSDRPPVAFCVEHADGLRATHLMLHGHLEDFCVALRTKSDQSIQAGRVAAGDAGNFYAHFARLNHVIEEMFLSRRPPVPIERTLLTTGAIAAGMRALAMEGKCLETPHLQIAYRTDGTR